MILLFDLFWSRIKKIFFFILIVSCLSTAEDNEELPSQKINFEQFQEEINNFENSFNDLINKLGKKDDIERDFKNDNSRIKILVNSFRDTLSIISKLRLNECIGVDNYEKENLTKTIVDQVSSVLKEIMFKLEKKKKIPNSVKEYFLDINYLENRLNLEQNEEEFEEFRNLFK